MGEQGVCSGKKGGIMDESLRDLFPDFIEETADILTRVGETLKTFGDLPSEAEREAAVADMFRGVHTIKGGCAMFGLNELKEFSHKIEALLGAFRGKAVTLTADRIQTFVRALDKIDEGLRAAEAQFRGVPAVENPTPLEVAAVSVEMPVDRPMEKPAPLATHELVPAAQQGAVEVLRVPLSLVSTALNNIWEVFLIRNQIGYLFEKEKEYLKDRLDLLQSWENLDSALKRHISELESAVMAMRMTSVKPLFSRMEKAVRSYLTSHPDKKIEFKTAGERTELDKKVMDMLGEPLIHLIRNAMDHGVEKAEERVKRGKSETGTILLAAEALADRVVVTVSDDGNGINGDKLVQKAQEKGIDVASFLKSAMPVDLIFCPGFSTAEVVTDVSGRGVGMDVVKHSIDELGGSIEIRTEIGKGTHFIISLPLSLSVIFSTLFEVGGELYGANIGLIVEICRMNRALIKKSNGASYILFREKFLEVYDLAEFLGKATLIREEDDFDVTLLVIRIKGEFVAVLVGGVRQNIEIVVKPVPELLPRYSFVQGMSILPTGQAVFILALDKVVEAIHMSKRISGKDVQKREVDVAAQ
ncbi:MAG TPA: hypothetical protein DIS93_06700 [Bdellovibrionales bacterium]|nr:hypothetical protein [Bdellovibrionales bacterium]